MNQINEKIKELFKTKSSFARFLEIDERDIHSKIKTVNKKIEWLNAFLKPLNLTVKISDISET